MKLIRLNPRSSGTRHQLNLTKSLLSKNNNILKNLSLKVKQSSGRSNITGHITTRHKGGGCKKKFRKIQFTNFNTKSILLVINYDPYRNAFISLNFDFLTKQFFYSSTTQATFPGTILVCHKKNSELYFGNRSRLLNFPIGVFINNLNNNSFSFQFAKFARAAGTYCQIIQKQKTKVQIRLPSGKFILTKADLFATFGRVSNIKYNLTILGKAGRNRLKGVRPCVRGIAMNPVDHPHGGRTNGGRPSVSP
jgi:large subunit ribosomal protein L2